MGLPRKDTLLLVACFVALGLVVIVYQFKLNRTRGYYYALGWINGRVETTNEAAAIYNFTQCVKSASAQACWDAQIQDAQRHFADWDRLSESEKFQHSLKRENHKWIDALRKGDRSELPLPRATPSPDI